MSRKYKAYALITYELECEFEVPEGEDPWDVAREIDGGNFREIDGTSDWKLYEVEEIK